MHWRCVVHLNDNVWFQKIHTPPPTEGICRMTPPPHWVFQNRSPKFTPLPSGISKIFAHPLEIFLSLIEVNKEVALFTRMPNFVSFMYFLLNCITDKRIPYANSLCAQVTDKFCEFHLISVEFYNSAWNARSRSKHNCTFLALRQEESNTWRSIIKEIRTSSRDKTVWVSNFVLPNLRIWVCGKIARCRFRVLDPSLPRTSNCWRSRDKSFASRLSFTTCVLNVGR